MLRRPILGAILLALAAIVYNYATGHDDRFLFQSVQGKNNTVLFITAEHPGLCNVHIATAYSLLVNHPDIDIHYASHPKLAKQLTRIAQLAGSHGAAKPHIEHHVLSSPSYSETVTAIFGSTENIMHPPGVEGIKKMVVDMGLYIAPWTAEDYWEATEEILNLIDEVDPAVVVIDNLFGPGIDATRHLRRLHALVSPNLLIDTMPAVQPAWTLFWKYPVLGSGIPYPVPWNMIWSNIKMNFKLIRGILYMPDIVAKRAYLKSKGINRSIDFMGLYRPDMPWISQTLPGAHLPMVKMADNLTLAGPINLAQLEEQTSQGIELLAWIKQKKTLLVCLGSGFIYPEATARRMLEAIENVIKQLDVQVLWKLNAKPGYSLDFIEEAMKRSGGRLKVERWLDVEPPTLLLTGDIAAFVHHGGAGSFHDVLGAGIPQVVLPLWVDLYDIAQLSEGLGIGIWGCRESSPHWTVECLQRDFVRVLQNSTESESLAIKAAEFGEVAKNKTPGRDIAAQMVSNLAASGYA